VVAQPTKQKPLLASLQRFRWASIFFLGLLAYAPVITLWFAGDDFSHLFGYHQLLPGLSAFTTGAGQFYRPIGTVLTWNLGYNLFGTEALPYHIISLVLHSCAAWLLARTVATISGEDRVGWIAGALFALYPLCTEPVAWLAAQWDPMAACCALIVVWGFAYYWKTKNWRAYAVALVAMTVGVFTKETVLPVPFILPFVGIVTQFNSQPGRIITPETRQAWVALLRRALLLSAPFVAPSLIFAILRIIFHGSIGGYEGVRTDYLHFFWDAITHAGLNTLMPLNRAVFDARIIQITGMAISSGFLLGLFLWGRQRWPLHFLAAVWWLTFLAPVVNILNYDQSTEGNRLFYFSFMGFCISGAAILASAVDVIDKLSVKWLAPALALLLIGVTIPVTWMQLGPWVQGSSQAKRIVLEMDRVLVPLVDKRLQLNVRDLPPTYRGAYLFLNGFDAAMDLFTQRVTITKDVDELNPSVLAGPFDDVAGISGIYNLAFSLDPKHQLYHISEASGVSIATRPPMDADKVWDYLGCSSTTNLEWQANEADFVCASSVISPPVSATGYATFVPGSSDSILQSPDLNMNTAGNTWIRLGVLARGRKAESSLLGSWWWKPTTDSDSGALKRINFALERNQNWRVYWTFVPASQIGRQLQGLKLSVNDSQAPVDIGWISVKAIR
jgi:hypothetical protein